MQTSNKQAGPGETKPSGGARWVVAPMSDNARPSSKRKYTKQPKSKKVAPALVVDKEFGISITVDGKPAGICLGDVEHATTYAQLLLDAVDNHPFPLEDDDKDIALGVLKGETVTNRTVLRVTDGLSIGKVATLLVEQALQVIPESDRSKQIWLLGIKRGVVDDRDVIYFPEVEFRE
ncbi:hypothetical protein OH76DRAFT_628502 [Lentinus brumalis]|uniref:Uncharacterized protein n=1 Tax=Lentinus brumalis TaxID=2498619 RepID=A0A371D8D0_9APHY|nr:hypothetical protein OH76DRAFT_628502 [Polyporus brumalis]